MIYLITGLPGSGKTTIAKLLATRLQAAWLDGDSFRKLFDNDLGHSDMDKCRNLRRAGTIAHYLRSCGKNVVCSFVAATYASRIVFKELAPGMMLIYLHCPQHICAERHGGPIWPGYEVPVGADLVLDTYRLSIPVCVGRILNV